MGDRRFDQKECLRRRKPGVSYTKAGLALTVGGNPLFSQCISIGPFISNLQKPKLLFIHT